MCSTLVPGVLTGSSSVVVSCLGPQSRLERVLRSAASEMAADPASVTGAARWLVERLAVALQASLLVRFSTRKVADAFLAALDAGEIVWGEAAAAA